MEPFKLRFKIGQHEFEAEGDKETVERQLAVWRDLITQLPSPPPPAGGLTPPAPNSATGAAPAAPPPPASDSVDYDKLFRQDRRGVVSLTVLPQGDRALPSAGLLVMLGRKHYVDEDLVGGAWLLDGLRQSGMAAERADRVFDDYYPQFVTTVGAHRAIRYRLTNLGMARALELAKELEGMVA